MPTPTYFTGFNPQVLSTSGLFDFIDFPTDVSIDTANPRHPGGAALRVHTLSVAGGDLGFIHPSPGNDFVSVFYARFATLPDRDCDLNTVVNAGGSTPIVGVGFNFANTQLCCYFNDGTNHLSNPGGPVLQAGVWYRVELHINAAANPWLVDIQVAVGDGTGVPLTQTSIAFTAGLPASTKAVLGVASIGAILDVNLTDWMYGFTGADYPIGPITVRGYSPDGVGSHNLDASPSVFFFQHSGSDTALTTSETTSYQTIDDQPIGSGSDYAKIAPQTTFSAISRIGGAAAAATSVTIPAHAVGDLMLMMAWRTASSSAPTVPSGWTLLASSNQTGATKCFVGLYFKIATATNDTSGTWTSATGLVCEVYRNAATPAGTDAVANSGVSTTQNYAAKTISDTTNSWFAAFGASASSGGNVAPSGLTLRNGVASTLEGSDSNGVRASNWPSTNVTITSQAWGTVGIEVKAASTTTEPANTEYAEWTFADETTILTAAPIGVRAYLALDQDSANAAGVITARIYDGTSAGDIVTALAVNSATKIYKQTAFSTPPSGGSWTLALLNALRLRYGFTANASGAMRLEGALVEAAFPVKQSLVYSDLRVARNTLLRR